MEEDEWQRCRKRIISQLRHFRSNSLFRNMFKFSPQVFPPCRSTSSVNQVSISLKQQGSPFEFSHGQFPLFPCSRALTRLKSSRFPLFSHSSFLSFFARHANSLRSRLETTRIETRCFRIFFSLHRFDFASFQLFTTTTSISSSTRSIPLYKLKLILRR